MSHQKTSTPLSHERCRRALEPGRDRVDDEYVFVAVADDPARDASVPMNHSVRVDPSDGPPGELRLHVVRERRVDGGSRQREESAVVTISAPGIDETPRACELDSVLESWYRRHLDPQSTAESAPHDLDFDLQSHPGPRDHRAPSHGQE